MNSGRTLFAQVMDYLPWHEFRKSIDLYRGNRRVRTLSCMDQLLTMMFGQLTYRESLRDTVTCLLSHGKQLYHCGIRGTISRSTLSDANEHRDWRIYADLAAVLIRRARDLYAQEDLGLALERAAYALDSTTIDLCLSLFPWAKFRRHKSAVKLHTLLDLRGNIPCFVHISSGRMADVKALDLLRLEPGAFYVMDKGYTDFARLHRFVEAMAFFLIRAKCDLVFERRSRRAVDKSTGLRSDQTIVLSGPKTSRLYPEPLRRIGYHAEDIGKRFVFLTNNFSLPALTIAHLYKRRWRVELFFKWIKHYLRIKSFFGRSVNAVKTQVWIALSLYVLVAIIKKELNIDRSLGEMLQILSVSPFEKMPLLQAFSLKYTTQNVFSDCNQLSLFDI
jgi:hypothetical protein